MTYQTIRKSFSKEQVAMNREQGVTLLVAILILSSILAISFSLSTILLIEVKTSGELPRTNSALYGADGVGEQALFNIIRKVPSPAYITQFTNNNTMATQPVTSSTSSPIFLDKVTGPTTSTTTPNRYDFCQISDGAAGCGYGKVIITYLSTGNNYPLIAYLCEFSPNQNYNGLPCTDVTNSVYWKVSAPIEDSPSHPNGNSITSGTPTANTTWTLDPNKQQQLILFTSGSAPVYVSIQTFAADGTTPKGLPLTGKQSVDITVTNGQSNRKIQVVVPTH